MRNIIKEIEHKRGEIIKLLSKLIAAKTVNPPGDEYKVAKIIEEEFKKAKIRYKKFEKQKGRTNIIGYIGKGKPELMLVAHADTVPAGEDWKTNPFKAAIKGDKIYGRGAADNKGPLASIIILGKILKKYEKQLKGTLMLAILADEETGSVYGINYLLKKGIKARYAIAPDVAHNMREIDIAEKGLLNIEIISHGKQAHGASPQKGINAIYNMNEFLNLLKHYQLKYKKHKLLSKPTINLGIIKGGTAHNIVPATCSVILNIRYLPYQTIKKITNEINSLLKKVKRKNKTARFEVNIIDDMEPSEIDENNELVRSIKKNTKKILKIKPTLFGLSGATVAKQLVLNKIIAVGFGPGDNDVAHTANELISIKELVNFAKISSLVVFDLICKKDKL
jgi:acetylornithine deacetylase/succinyl-diaminopimelate desuccinylase family protein